MFSERDTPFTSETIITISIFVILYILSKKAVCARNSKFINSLFWGVVLFCIFDFCDGDFFHYKEHFNNIKLGYLSGSLENVYLSIIDFAPTYYIFRFIVWGGAFYLIKIATLKLNIWNERFIFLFVVYCILIFAYARVSLALSIALCGFSVIIYKKNYINLFLGISIIIVSLLFHKSILLILILIPLSFLPLNRHTFKWLILSLPILIYVVNHFAIQFLGNFNLNEEQSAAVTNYIMESDGTANSGIARKLIDFSIQLPTYIGVYLIIKNWYLIKQNYFPLVRWSIYIVIFATSFIFFPFTNVIFYRIMYLARVPIVFSLTSMNMRWRNLKLFISLSVFSDIISLSYSLYLSIVK